CALHENGYDLDSW
nr:immunoglobulin heavy chain junction region [Macaca mulatta]